MTASLRRRILVLSEPLPGDGCWLWRGHLKRNGYGTLGIKNGGCWRTAHAHRASYIAFFGPIPEGADLDHLCRHRNCVNPNHLEPVDRATNLRRSPLMNRQTHKMHCPGGHPYDGINNRGQRTCSFCKAAASRRYRARNVK